MVHPSVHYYTLSVTSQLLELTVQPVMASQRRRPSQSTGDDCSTIACSDISGWVVTEVVVHTYSSESDDRPWKAPFGRSPIRLWSKCLRVQIQWIWLDWGTIVNDEYRMVSDDTPSNVSSATESIMLYDNRLGTIVHCYTYYKGNAAYSSPSHCRPRKAPLSMA